MYQTRHISNLDIIEVPGQKSSPTVVLLHGYGAGADDLAPLSHVLRFPPGTGWLIPNGPLSIPLGPHYEGRAWAPINMEEWQRAMMMGRPRDLSGENPPELYESAKLILDMLQELKIEIENTVFSGFSQGAMLATHLALNTPVRPKGLIIFSGSLLNEKGWSQAMVNRQGFKYFQSHGENDEVLSIVGAQRLHGLFEKHNLIGNLVTFHGGHEIPPIALEKSQKYIEEIFPDIDSWQERD